MSNTVIGIDLGTTNTCVACYRNGQIKILENEEGGRITPSFIFVTEKDKIMVGYYAQRMAEAKPEYSIFELKRLIGRAFDDPQIQNSVKYFPFTVVSSYNKLYISISQKDDEFKKSPIDLCAALLAKIKRDAEAKLDTVIDKAVITVPAYFNVNQREATLSAANKAGFTVLKLLNEPTAAALSYYVEKTKNTLSLVYDLGGGTFDVAILRKTEDSIDIIGVDGDTHLGGHDFDNLIINYMCNYLQKHYKYDPKPNRRAMRRLRNICEEVKKTLSWAEEVPIVLEGFVDGCNTIEIQFTRKHFETMARDLFQKTINIVDNCLTSCKISKTDIKEVILSGGSTRIPKIQEMLSTYFGDKKLNKVVNPDEAVAEGAAIQAALLSTDKNQNISALKITDVTPLSLGVSDFVDQMHFCIKRNSQIPANHTSTFTTSKNKQQSMNFRVYEGERKNVANNRYLGAGVINDITPAPPGQCEIFLTMSIDINGILTVKASEKFRNNVKNLTIDYTRGHRSDKEVQNALNDAEVHKHEDERFVKFAKLKAYILKYCEIFNYNLEEKKLNDTYQKIYDFCTATVKKAEIMNLDDEEELKVLQDNIKKHCDDVVAKCNFEFMPTWSD